MICRLCVMITCLGLIGGQAAQPLQPVFLGVQAMPLEQAAQDPLLREQAENVRKLRELKVQGLTQEQITAQIRRMVGDDQGVADFQQLLSFFELVDHLPPATKGLLVTDFHPDAAIAKSGIRIGDIIVKIGAQPINDLPGLKEWVSTASADQTYLIVFLRYTPGAKKSEWKQQGVKCTPGREPPIDPHWIGFYSSVERLNLARSVREAEDRKVTPEQMPFELKGDRLGMTLDAFKNRHRREVDGKLAPYCSDTEPDRDDKWLLYRAVEGKVGIVNARLTFPFEERGPLANPSTIAGVRALVYVHHFVDGKLYQITVAFKHADYRQVVDALKAKHGEPAARQGVTYENLFGAKFRGDVMLWANDVSEMLVIERAENVEHGALVLRHKQLGELADERLKKAARHAVNDL